MKIEKNIFYYLEKKYYGVLSIIEQYFNLNFIELEMEEWDKIENVLMKLKEEESEDRDFEKIKGYGEEGEWVYEKLKEFSKNGRYGYYEKREEIEIQDLEGDELSIFDIYSELIFDN